MEILDLRHFSSADLRPLLEDEIAMWGRQLSWDYSTSAEMILRYMDAKILPGYAAIERGSIFGYSFFVYEQSKGVIGDLFVRDCERRDSEPSRSRRTPAHPRHRDPAAVARHPSRGGAVAGAPHRRSLASLSATGLQPPSPRVHEFRNRRSIRKPRRRLPPQFEIRPWSEQEYQPAAAVITAAYRGHVDSEINDQYRTLAGSLRFLNNIVRFPGCGTFDPRASFVVFERRTRTLIGLILCSLVRPDVGHITQVCVLPGIPLRRAWRSDDGGVDSESARTGISLHFADCNRSQ